MKKLAFIFCLTLFYACFQKEEKQQVEIPLQEKDEEQSSTCPPNLLYSVWKSVGFHLYVNEVTQEGFENNLNKDYIRWDTIANSESFELSLQKEIPKLFTKRDSSYFFLPKFGGERVEVKNNIVQEKSYSEYKFIGQYKDLVLLYQQYYEGQVFLVINKSSGNVFSFGHLPRFMTENRMFSLGESYGYIDFHVVDLKDHRYTSLSFESFVLRECYSAYGNTIHMKLEAIYPHSGFSYFSFRFNNAN